MSVLVMAFQVTAYTIAVRLVVFALCGGYPGECTGELPGDVRLVGVNSFQGMGELQVAGEDGAWADVCSGAVGVVEAQVACQDLGFSFLSSFTAVADPTHADSMFSMTLINCFSVLQQHSSGDVSVALTVTSMHDCELDYETNKPCGSTVHLICQNESIADNALLVFTDRRLFWVIAPGIPLLTQCRSEQFYCDSTILVPSSAQFFQLFRAGQTCGTVNMTYFFDIVCTPSEGDVCLLQSVSSCKGAGLVTFVRNARQLGVCVESFGFLEAYVICNQLGLPKLQSFSNVLLADYNLPVEVISADCNGTERDFGGCLLEVNNNCPEIVDLTCGFGEFLDTAVVGVSADPSEPFTVISPADGVYVDDCQPSRPLHCPGVYYMKRTLPSIQDIILKGNKSCSQLGPIDLSIPCSLPNDATTITPYTSIDIIVTQTRTSLLPFQTLAASPKDINDVHVSLASLSVFPMMLIVFVGISLYVCYRQHQKRKVKEILEELETLHSLNRAHNEYARPSLTAIRPHRSVDLRRPSNNSDGYHDDMEIPFNCLTLDKEIGSGAYGSIYHGMIACEHQKEPIEVAVKVLKHMATASEQRSLQLEINMMKELGYHRHLVTMLAWSLKGNKLALVMEYIRDGNLHDFLRNHRHKVVLSAISEVKVEPDDDGGSRDEEEKDDTCSEGVVQALVIQEDEILPSGGSLTLINQLQFARQITLGMEYLASMKIVHRDLAARNVLVGEDQILKLADFGLSRGIKDNKGYYMKGVEDKLPVRWMAVESILDREFTLMSDVWAFGVVLWEIMTYAAFPFHHLTNREVISSIKAGGRMAQPDGCPDKVYDIMVQCWKADPLQRPPIWNVRVMLDDLLDTGGYMCLVENDISAAEKLLLVHCSMQNST